MNAKVIAIFVIAMAAGQPDSSQPEHSIKWQIKYDYLRLLGNVGLLFYINNPSRGKSLIPTAKL